ncbi:MAG: putative transcriptional regulator, ModE family [Rhizobium sp.]|nr:putative transcriptional regulator, ModE family [Rhizobium sp.]
MSRAIKTNLRFTFPGGAPLSHGKAELMELIRETGSIRQAASRMGMSYRRGWLLTDELNRMFVHAVIETKHGGKSGGGAGLTEFGEALLARFRDMEKRTATTLKADLEWLESNARPQEEKAGPTEE